MTDQRSERQTQTQKRSAERITLVTFVLMTLLAFATIFLVPEPDKTPIDNLMMPFVALSAGYAYYLARKGKHQRGIYILLISIAIATALYPLAAENIGWQAAIIMLLIATSIAYSALPEDTAGRIASAAFVFAIIIILIDLFTTGVTNIPPTPSAAVITAALGIVYLGIVFRRFRSFPLQTKLTVVFLFLSALSAGAVTIAINRLSVAQLTARVEQQLTGVASQTAAAINAELNTHINLLRTLALNSTIAETLAKNQTSGDMEELLRRDAQWRQADAANNNADPLVRSVLNHEISRELTLFREKFPAHAEVFITDKYGANIAATNRTTDYYQADEEWWQKAYNDGKGAVFISQPVFDESANLLAVQMAIPIFDLQNDSVIGVLRTTLNLEIFVPIFENARLAATGRTEIYLPGGFELEIEREEDGAYHLTVEEAPSDFVEALAQGTSFMDTFHEGEATLAAQSPLPVAANSPEISEALQRLEWRAVTLQNRGEALQTVSDLTRAAQLAGIGVLAIAGLMAAALAQVLTRPILRLTQTAEAIAAGDIQASVPVDSPDEIGALAESFNRMTAQLRESLTTLERRVAERTADLETARLLSERRAQELRAISDISRIIASEQRLDILLPLITQLVSERLGFYHVGIFIVDDTRQFAVLQAANSEGGRRMLERGHRLEVGQTGIVGSVTGTGQPRIALDVGADPVFFNNPDLPTTRSEMALPLKLRDRIIGALDVQSEKPGAFTEEDANTLSILADHIAIAIENARLFTQTQQSLQEIQTLYRQNLQEGWIALSRRETTVGYHHGAGGGKKLAQPIFSEQIQQAMNRGKTMLFSADGSAHEPTLVIPLKLRGQVIGAVNIKAPAKERRWTTAEINFAEAVSERLSLALENVRLLQDSQRRAVKEQAISEITSKISASIDLKNVLQTAVEELGRSLPGSEVVIQFQNGNAESGKEQK